MNSGVYLPKAKTILRIAKPAKKMVYLFFLRVIANRTRIKGRIPI
ncbi:unnamed protein product [marine sediment metagenome]|uniref:Uncharacterized protein n=1 Tax=marine sediment metagenome TaxID=412755 RepID=X1J2H9_9ZZZZ